MDGKRLAIRPDEAPTLLRALAILQRDASMPPQERRKFFQIKHMVTLLMPSLRPLADAVRWRRPLCGFKPQALAAAVRELTRAAFACQRRRARKLGLRNPRWGRVTVIRRFYAFGQRRHGSMLPGTLRADALDHARLHTALSASRAALHRSGSSSAMSFTG